jgi:hypothetical protein
MSDDTNDKFNERLKNLVIFNLPLTDTEVSEVRPYFLLSVLIISIISIFLMYIL